MDYKKMTETRQSCRAFDPVRTPDRAVLTQVLEAARLAPSACNSQPYHFYVAVDGTARAVGAATQSLGMNKFAGDCPLRSSSWRSNPTTAVPPWAQS